jgi:hypothetical protein
VGLASPSDRLSASVPTPLPLSSMEAMAAWMEERRGDMGLALEEPWVQPLGDLLQAGKWSVRTIVKDGMSVTKQAEAVWEALLTESTRMIATAGGEPPSALAGHVF